MTGRYAGPGSSTGGAATAWPLLCTARALHVTGIAAGLHAVLELPGTDAERQLVAGAARHGLALQGLEGFRTAGPAAAGPGQAGLVIGYGRPPEHAYTTALARLCAVLGPELIEPPPSLGPRPVRG
jgi:DNA-binding transcriptional MocR family regulator